MSLARPIRLTQEVMMAMSKVWSWVVARDESRRLAPLETLDRSTAARSRSNRVAQPGPSTLGTPRTGRARLARPARDVGLGRWASCKGRSSRAQSPLQRLRGLLRTSAARPVMRDYPGLAARSDARTPCRGRSGAIGHRGVARLTAHGAWRYCPSYAGPGGRRDPIHVVGADGVARELLSGAARVWSGASVLAGR